MDPNLTLLVLGGLGFLIVVYLIFDSGSNAAQKLAKTIGITGGAK